MRLKNTFAKLSGVASGLLLSGLLALNGVEARLVADDNGTSVDVPEHISRIVVTNILPLASAVTMYLGDGSRIVGMHPARVCQRRNLDFWVTFTQRCFRLIRTSFRAQTLTSNRSWR